MFTQVRECVHLLKSGVTPTSLLHNHGYSQRVIEVACDCARFS